MRRKYYGLIVLGLMGCAAYFLARPYWLDQTEGPASRPAAGLPFPRLDSKTAQTPAAATEGPKDGVIAMAPASNPGQPHRQHDLPTVVENYNAQIQYARTEPTPDNLQSALNLLEACKNLAHSLAVVAKMRASAPLPDGKQALADQYIRQHEVACQTIGPEATSQGPELARMYFETGAVGAADTLVARYPAVASGYPVERLSKHLVADAYQRHRSSLLLLAVDGPIYGVKGSEWDGFRLAAALLLEQEAPMLQRMISKAVGTTLQYPSGSREVSDRLLRAVKAYEEAQQAQLNQRLRP